MKQLLLTGSDVCLSVAVSVKLKEEGVGICLSTTLTDHSFFSVPDLEIEEIMKS